VPADTCEMTGRWRSSRRGSTRDSPALASCTAPTRRAPHARPDEPFPRLVVSSDAENGPRYSSSCDPAPHHAYLRSRTLRARHPGRSIPTSRTHARARLTTSRKPQAARVTSADDPMTRQGLTRPSRNPSGAPSRSGNSGCHRRRQTAMSPTTSSRERAPVRAEKMPNRCRRGTRPLRPRATRPVQERVPPAAARVIRSARQASSAHRVMVPGLPARGNERASEVLAGWRSTSRVTSSSPVPAAS